MISPKLMQFIPQDGLVLIIGRRGSGKSVLAYGLLEALHRKRQTYVYNFPKPDLLPSYIKVINTLDFPEDSIVLIDEAYMNFPARKAMAWSNRFIDSLNGLARQKNLLIFYVSQETSRVDLNIIRGIDVLFIKALSVNQVRFERKELRSYLQRIKDLIDKLNNEDLIKRSTYVSCDLIGKRFEGLIINSNTPPSFWSEELSKAWRDVSLIDDKKDETLNLNSLTCLTISNILGKIAKNCKDKKLKTDLMNASAKYAKRVKFFQA
ncbi:MAG TPA: hypothetical protein ENG63_07030 [Candidatus Desulfofervidus auxilii]|uniref:Uncharacterized protein n=1 Tax=Desulfofervidus auxilii TaxID=1621989 RepID=A0A7C0U331_DESA2|nr:hypothetical protein [Candidatus Desulfofervidus auxilii]